MELTYDKNNDNKLSLTPPTPNLPSTRSSHPFDRFCYTYHPLSNIFVLVAMPTNLSP